MTVDFHAISAALKGDDASITPHGFKSAANLDGVPVPARTWLAEGWIPGRNVTLLSGDGGTGKSLLALQLATSVALDISWVGIPVARGPAIYFSAEDEADELHRRLDDIVIGVGSSFSELSDLHFRSVAGDDALLAFETTLKLAKSPLFMELEAAAAAIGPKLIVIDTLADVYPANENDRAKVRQFVGMLRGLALTFNCAVVLLSHPSLSGMTSGSGTSGSTAWSNSARSRLYLERNIDQDYEVDPNKRTLRTKKLNYGQLGGEVQLTWRAGRFVADAPAGSLDSMAASAKAQRVFLNLLTEFTTQGRKVNYSGGTNYAPRIMAEDPAAEGVTKRAFRAAMNSLFAAEKIAIENEGPPSRPVSFLVVKRS